MHSSGTAMHILNWRKTTYKDVDCERICIQDGHALKCFLTFAPFDLLGACHPSLCVTLTCAQFRYIGDTFNGERFLQRAIEVAPNAVVEDALKQLKKEVVAG